MPRTTTAAAWPATECWIHPRSSRSINYVRNSASSPSDRRFTGRDSGGIHGGAPLRTSAYWAFNAENTQSSAATQRRRGADPRPPDRRTQGGFRAVREHLHAVNKLPVAARFRYGRLQMGLLEGGKLGVFLMDWSQPPWRAAGVVGGGEATARSGQQGASARNCGRADETPLWPITDGASATDGWQQVRGPVVCVLARHGSQ